MRHLAVIAVLLAGCYDGEIGDCELPCATAGECPDGLACGSDGWCAAPEVAGTCAATAPASLEVRVVVRGKGAVIAADPALDCRGDSPNDPVTCALEVVAGTAVELTATPVHQHWQFDGWDGADCDGPVCTIRPDAALVVTARFGQN